MITLGGTDRVILDGVEYDATPVPGTDDYWLEEVQLPLLGLKTVSFMRLSAREMADYAAIGRLVVIRGAATHVHAWAIYRGLNVVERYCHCGEKQAVDWKELPSE